MSSYSFSHQFYQHWKLAPEPVRAAITQELKDITTLLQIETPFESFVFSTHDLDAHVDELYKNHEAEQAIAKAIADKEAQARADAEQQRLAEEQRVAQEEARALAEAERIETEKQKEKAEKQKAEAAQQEIKNASSNNAAENITSEELNDKQDKLESSQDVSALKGKQIADKQKDTTDTAASKKGPMIDLSSKDQALHSDHESLIHELGVHIDDYLSEQMMQLSEDLKSWLRAEVSRQLADITEKSQDLKAAEDNL